ncbi:hypothetical protein FF1_037706 [Malus domestica]
MSVATTAATTMTTCRFVTLRIQCTDSKPRTGFGSKTNSKNKNKNKNKNNISQESTTKQSGGVSYSGTRVNSRFDGKVKRNPAELEFEECLAAVKSCVRNSVQHLNRRSLSPIEILQEPPINYPKKRKRYFMRTCYKPNLDLVDVILAAQAS